MGVLFNKVDRNDLKEGDHVYSWRTGYTYAHHGIFVGNDDVVHFTKGFGQKPGARVSLINSLASSSIPKQHLSCPRSSGSCGLQFKNSGVTISSLDPGSCGLQFENSGVMISCLDCFLEGGPVYRFEYGVCIAVFFAQVRGGTCTLAQSDAQDIVTHRAKYLLLSGFGIYDLSSNNCEDFAIYCKTGFMVNRNASGGSGQVAAANSVCSAYRYASLSLYVLNNSAGLAILAATYLLKRYRADIGVRVDKTKVPVEDLAVFLDSSTSIRVDKNKEPVEDMGVFLDSSIGKKPPVQDSAVYLDSSTTVLDDKTKLPVEDVSVFLDSSSGKNFAVCLDSSTGKKLPVEDLAVCLDSSSGKNFAVCLDSSTGKKLPVEDLAVCLDSSSGKNFAVCLDSSTGKKLPVEDLAVCLDSSSGKNFAVCLDSSTGKKLPVEDLAVCLDFSSGKNFAVCLDSSTGKKLPVEDLAVCLDSSTGKNFTVCLDSSTGKKLPVEDLAVCLDSSTGKKPPVAESSTPHEISRNRSSKKQKKKRIQQHRKKCQLAQDVEDVAVFLDSSTGKKPSAAESSTSQTLSRNRSSQKQKKKARDRQHRRNCELVQGPTPRGPVLHGN